MWGWANDPRLYVLVDKIPQDLVYEVNKEEGLYFAEKEGYVDFYSWKGPRNEGGYCGRGFNIKLKDGTKINLLGPWSSRCSVMNKFGFKHSFEVAIVDNEEVYDKDLTFYSGALTIEILEPIIKNLGAYLIKEEDRNGEIRYIISSDPKEKKK